MKYPPARLDSSIYGKWLKESPKKIEGGPLELSCCDGHSEEDDAYNLESRSIYSSVLDSPNIKQIYIMGAYAKFEGLRIYVNIKDKYQDKFLLMGHQHHSGPFEAEDGRSFGDHPHFHQIKYYKKRSTFETEVPARGARKTYEVPSALSEEMNSKEFLKAFKDYYYLVDGENGEVKTQSRDHFQSELGKFEEPVG